MDVLIIDNNALIRRAVRAYLSQARYRVHETQDGKPVWDLLQRQPIPLLITTWPIPGVDGVELLRRIRAARSPVYTYIILMANRNDDESLIEGMQAGADDYLINPINLKQLRRRVILGGRIQRLENRLYQTQSERDTLLTRDNLTGLLNRQAIYDRSTAELARVKREGKSLSLVLLDIDHLRAINERYGYEIGDQALRRVSETILRTVRQRDSVGRWGNAEFLFILPETTLGIANSVAERVRGRVATTEIVAPDGKPFSVTASLGVTSTSFGLAPALSSLLHEAERALSLAKQRGRNCVGHLAGD